MRTIAPALMIIVITYYPTEWRAGTRSKVTQDWLSDHCSGFTEKDFWLPKAKHKVGILITRLIK